MKDIHNIGETLYGFILVGSLVLLIATFAHVACRVAEVEPCTQPHVKAQQYCDACGDKLEKE